MHLCKEKVFLFYAFMSTHHPAIMIHVEIRARIGCSSLYICVIVLLYCHLIPMQMWNSDWCTEVCDIIASFQLSPTYFKPVRI